MRQRPSTGVLVGMVVVFGLAVAGLIGTAVVLRGDTGPPAADRIDLTGLQPLAPRAVYLADGTPAFVIAHADGMVSLLSAFDAHRPNGFGQMVWWCPRSEAFDGPQTGTRYDEYGARVGGGPAPSGLASWALTVDGNTARVGEALAPPAFGAPSVGSPPEEEPGCVGQDPIVLPTFEDWKIWDSPTALVRAAPSGWALITGDVLQAADEMQLCALTGCTDAAATPELTPPPPEWAALERALAPLWLVRVTNGVLVDVTRVIDPADWVR